MITATLSPIQTITADLSGSPQTIGAMLAPEMPAEYEGSYEFTPSAERQTIQIKGKMATEDIIVKSIPSNYGLIEWNGSALTVS